MICTVKERSFGTDSLCFAPVPSAGHYYHTLIAIFAYCTYNDLMISIGGLFPVSIGGMLLVSKQTVRQFPFPPLDAAEDILTSHTESAPKKVVV